MKNNKTWPLFTLQCKGGKDLPPLNARDGQNIYLKYNSENKTKNYVQETLLDSLLIEISEPLDKGKWEREWGFGHFEEMGFEVVTLGGSLHCFLPNFY